MSKYWDNVEAQRLRERVENLWLPITVCIVVGGGVLASRSDNPAYMIGMCVTLFAWVTFGDLVLARIFTWIDALRAKRKALID